MPHKPVDPQEAEFKEAMEALQKVREGLLANSDPNEDAYLAFRIDQSRKIVQIRCFDGGHGSISTAEFRWIQWYIGKPCLLCTWPLAAKFEQQHRPVLYLICNRCQRAHRVALGELCIYVR